MVSYRTNALETLAKLLVIFFDGRDGTATSRGPYCLHRRNFRGQISTLYFASERPAKKTERGAQSGKLLQQI
jgi:hypothetical protein